MTNTQHLPREQKPLGPQDHEPPAENGTGEDAPILPGWISGGGWILLAAIGVILVVLCVNAGTSYGDADGWSLFLAVALPPAAWLWSSFARRTEGLQLRKRRELRSSIRIREIDRLTWQEFETQCIILLQLLGYTNVKKTENLPNVKAVDITATNPDSGKREIFECKHRKLSQVGKVTPVGAREVNELIGRIASGMYKGLPVTLMTNAQVTGGPRQKAAEHGISIIGRERLTELMAQAADEPGNRVASDREVPAPHARDVAAKVQAGAGRLITTWFSALRPETKLATAVTGAGGLAVLIVVLQMAVTGPRAAAVPPTAPGPHSAAANGSRAAYPPVKPAIAGNGETPEAVAVKFFTAISDHDWPEVWQLGGKNTGHSSYATYEGMVSGYRDTIRDVPVTMAVAGDTVSGRFFAYETGNRVQRYAFTYVIRNGAIVSASQQFTATTR
jgi:Restriction endonuclease